MKIYNFKLIIFFIIHVVLSSLSNTAFGFENKIGSLFLLSMNNDTELGERKSYTGIILENRFKQLRAVKLSLLESKIKLKSLNSKIYFEEIIALNSKEAIKKIKEKVPIGAAVILDVPTNIMKSIVYSLKNKNIALINARSRNMGLRLNLCQKNLFHIIPSFRMYTDALAQFLYTKNWKKLIIIHGKNIYDKQMIDSFLLSSKKYSLKIALKKIFSTSNNPKDREQSNSLLLTSHNDHDAIVVFDKIGEYSRFLPFNTHLSRLVFGSVGLKPRAWHWSWERFGAPQLNQRFNRRVKTFLNDNNDRNMDDEDWAAWASIKLLVESIKNKNSEKDINFLKLLKFPDLSVDLYKGSVGSIRKWNNQMRQPILLTTHNAVISVMPNNKFLHEKFNEDTLGLDRLESSCQLK
jgi:ABC transporter substrate binding protein (PQQ-dependent alcohol dehydrogenase system)|tara:strand:- start:636 stop:1856 length:1221 start_codon:yes stop_codon:yes gene_type:complete